MIGFNNAFFEQSLVVTINLQLNPSSLTAEDSPRSRSRSTTTWTVSFQLNYADSYILSARTTHRKHSYSIVECVSVGAPT
jgi:hypothetical protein